MEIKKHLYLILLSFVIIGCSFNSNSTDGVFSVKDFGAIGDSVTLNTSSFQKALDAAHEAGGKVIVPQGKYLTGTIYLKSNTILELMPGATILGSTNIKDYDSLYWGHNEDRTPYHLIVAKGAQNVTIQGRGTIDGQGKNWYEHTDVKPRWMHKIVRRPSPMIEIDSCTNVRVTGVTLTNAAGWTLHTFNSDHIVIDGIRLINNLFGPNNDGIDLTGCNDVMVANSYIETSDDAVCVKTTTDSRTSSNVTVTNCVMQTTCVALKCGETSKSITDLTFSNCVITKSSRAFGIYATWGGDVENVMVSNIIANTNAPLVLNRPFQIAAWDARDKKTKEVIRKGGNVRNVSVSNFTATTEGRILINANDGHEISNISLSNIKLKYPYIENPELYGPEATSNQFLGIDEVGMKAKAAIVASNIKKFSLDGLDIIWNQTDTIPSEWKHPERIENGKFDKIHYPTYHKVKMAEFSALYTSNVQGGYVFAPLAESSDPSVKTFNINTSNIKIFDKK